MKLWIGMIVCVGGLVSAAQAAPFEMADIASDAAWVAHVDVEGLKDTRIGDFLLEEMNRKESAVKLDAIKAIFNFDPREDLHGATLYGADGRPEASVALLRGRLDAERLTTLVKLNPTYEQSDADGREIHSWIDQEKPDAKRVYAGFPDAGTLVISEARNRTELALNVLTGKGSSLDVDSRLASTIRDTQAAFFLAGANLSDIPDVAPEAAVLKKAKAFQLAFTAPDRDLKGIMRLTTDDQQTAEQVERILAGMVAFAQLNDADQPELAELAETVEITRDGDTVTCSMRHPIDEIVGHMRKDAERKRNQKGS